MNEALFNSDLSFADGTLRDSFMSIGKLVNFLLPISQTFRKTSQQTERY